MKLIIILFSFLTVISFANSTPINPAVEEQLQKLQTLISDLDQRVQSVTAEYDNEEVIPRKRDREYFKKDMTSLRTDFLSKDLGFSLELNNLRSLLSGGNNPTPQNCGNQELKEGEWCDVSANPARVWRLSLSQERGMNLKAESACGTGFALPQEQQLNDAISHGLSDTDSNPTFGQLIANTQVWVIGPRFDKGQSGDFRPPACNFKSWNIHYHKTYDFGRNAYSELKVYELIQTQVSCTSPLSNSQNYFDDQKLYAPCVK